MKLKSLIQALPPDSNSVKQCKNCSEPLKCTYCTNGKWKGKQPCPICEGTGFRK